jgi:hypothetical protein
VLELQEGSILDSFARKREEEQYIVISLSNTEMRRETREVDGLASNASRDLPMDSPGWTSSPCQSYTSPNSNMQMVSRSGAHRSKGQEDATSAGEEVATSEEAAPVLETGARAPLQPQDGFEKEKEELIKVKRFCSSILKTLAPLLLKEFENASGLRADAETFTPKRVTRRSTAAVASTKVKKASVANTTLLKALGICPKNMSVNEEDLRRFKEFFDSPMREAHIKVPAAIFGKEMPSSFERQEGCRGMVHALE